MDLFGYYKPEKENQVVMHEFVGQNIVRVCEDINPSMKPSFVLVNHKPLYPGHLATFSYASGEIELTAPDGKRLRAERVFLLDADMLNQQCSVAQDQDGVFFLLWSTIYAAVRQFVQSHQLPTEQLLSAALMEELVKLHPQLKQWRDVLLQHYVQGGVETEDYKKEIDSQIVCLVAASITMNGLRKKQRFNYSKVRRVLETTRQTFDTAWLRLA